MNCKMAQHILLSLNTWSCENVYLVFAFLLHSPFKDIWVPMVPRFMTQFVAVCQNEPVHERGTLLLPFGSFLKQTRTRPSWCRTHRKSPPYHIISFHLVCMCVVNACVFVCGCMYLCMHMWKPNDVSVFLSGSLETGSLATPGSHQMDRLAP